jgi:CheY-like chemotaxis protein
VVSSQNPMSTKVLVFESDPAFAGELRNELGKLGCTTTVVDDGNVGLQQAAGDRPDLILLAIELPRMNGFSVCNKLKKDANLKEVPLIIMSSESSDETFEQHKKLRTRAEDYVHKPIAFGELLQHIQTFVALGPIPSADTEAAIVIDDEIEIGSTDYLGDDEGTQIAMRPPLGMLTPAAQKVAEPVDADVDAFADAAFGRLTGSEPPGAMPGAVAEARPIHNGAREAAAAPAPAPSRRASAVPPKAQSARPAPIAPAGVDPAEHDKVRSELEAVRTRAADVERELGDARAEVDKLRLDSGEADRLRREVEELRVKLAAGPKAGGISSREFLDLREALNKKDKEILSLREAQSKKDREIVEGQDRLLALERTKSDLDERLLALDREVADAREKVEALTADKELAKKASDDLRARLEKSRAEVEGKERQLSELRAKHVEDMGAAEAKVAAIRADADQTHANERAEHARVVDQAEERRRADLDQAKRDREAALAEAKEQAEREQQEVLSAQGAQLRQEHDSKLASLHRAHQQELERARAAAAEAARDVDARHDAALAEARKNAEATLAEARRLGEEKATEARADAEKKGEAALETLRGEHAEKIVALENDRDARIAAIESKAAHDAAEANEKLAKLDMDLSATRGELTALRESKAETDASNAAQIATATERITVLEAQAAALRQDLGETKDKLATESSRADKAHTKWEGDRQSLERAKDALAVALSQIEEAEGRSIS